MNQTSPSALTRCPLKRGAGLRGYPKRKDTYGIREMESFAMTEFKPIKEGKVREIYDNGDSLIMSPPTASLHLMLS